MQLNTQWIKEGRNLERTFRSLAFLLNEWCRSVDTKHPQGMSVVTFDKLAMFFIRIWNEMCRRSQTKLEHRQVTDERSEEYITFYSPMVVSYGLHGPGLTRIDANGFSRSIVDMVSELEHERILEYFEFTRKSTGGPGRRMRSAYVQSSRLSELQKLLSDFTVREQVILNDLANAIRALSEAEIRALGSQSNKQQVMSAVAFNMGYASRLLGRIRDMLVEGIPFQEEAARLRMVTEETFRRLGNDRPDYESARAHLLELLHDPELCQVFKQQQKEGSSIWQSQKLQDLKHFAASLGALADYLSAIAHFQRETDIKAAARSQSGLRFRKLGETGLARLRTFGTVDLPEIFWDVFNPAGKGLKPHAKETMIGECERQRIEIEKVASKLRMHPGIEQSDEDA